MGYNTYFKGTLKFNTVPTGEMIDALQTILGEDCREHPEWNEPDLTHLNLEINEDGTGIQWNGQEKTYEMTGLVNLVLKQMRKLYPEFGLTGLLKAQGQDVGDVWEVFIGEDGWAYWRDLGTLQDEESPAIKDDDKEALLERALNKLRENRPVTIETDLTTAIALIGNAQLAFRHPGNNGPSRVAAEKLVVELIEAIDPAHGDMYEFLMMGFDERFDE